MFLSTETINFVLFHSYIPYIIVLVLNPQNILNYLICVVQYLNKMS